MSASASSAARGSTRCSPTTRTSHQRAASARAAGSLRSTVSTIGRLSEAVKAASSQSMWQVADTIARVGAGACPPATRRSTTSGRAWMAL